MTNPRDFDIRGLQKALRNTPSSVTSGLLESMLGSFKEQICINKCQFNRVVCILRPMCPQRHFLDLLLNSGYEHSDVPQFCYSVRLKEINENFKKEAYSLTSDVTILLTDFYRIFGQNKPRFHYKRDIKKIITFYAISNVIEVNTEVGETIILGMNKNIIFIDLDKGLVHINPLTWVILDQEIMLATLSVLSVEYGIKCEVTDQYEHSVVMIFSINKEETLNETQLEDAIRHSDTLMSYDIDTNEVFAELHIPQPNSTSFLEFNVEKIRDIFEELNNIRPKEAKEKQDQKSKIKDKVKS